MKRSGLLIYLCCLAFTTAAFAESKNVGDYPLRVHIFGRDQTTFYWHRDAEEAKGDGRANLFENGEPRGLDFNYDCSDKLRTSFGYQTYPAKWKKPGRELTVLFPKFGQTGEYWTCTLKTDLKDFAYTAHNGRMSSEPVAQFKDWMVRHDYDPEHGKNEPIRTQAAAPTSPGTTAPAPPSDGDPQ